MREFPVWFRIALNRRRQDLDTKYKTLMLLFHVQAWGTNCFFYSTNTVARDSIVSMLFYYYFYGLHFCCTPVGNTVMELLCPGEIDLRLIQNSNLDLRPLTSFNIYSFLLFFFSIFESYFWVVLFYLRILCTKNILFLRLTLLIRVFCSPRNWDWSISEFEISKNFNFMDESQLNLLHRSN